MTSAYTAASRAGLDTYCPTCMSVRGQQCVSRSGRVLKWTHDSRARAAMQPVREWFAAQMARRLA